MEKIKWSEKVTYEEGIGCTRENRTLLSNKSQLVWTYPKKKLPSS